jgi:hypothetical protein
MTSRRDPFCYIVSTDFGRRERRVSETVGEMLQLTIMRGLLRATITVEESPFRMNNFRLREAASWAASRGSKSFS